jgi:predicted amidohydrolase YtcJ
VSGGDLAGRVTAARRARPDGWLRAVGWPAVTRGELDRHALDRVDRQPLRVQDATGSTWYLNSAALDVVLAGAEAPPGMEVGPDGRPTGRLFRLDGWLRGRTGDAVTADLAALGRGMAARGVTSVTDATATNGPEELALLARAGLPQRLTAMTAAPATVPPDGVALGPVKILLDDRDLPTLPALVDRVADAHRSGRAVAAHCVTVAQLALFLAALGDAGAAPGDRVEHGAVVPDDLLGELRRSRVTVVTQPGFLRARGDQYLDEVDTDEQPWLYRVAALLSAGIPVRLSSDAPYGPADPWTAIAAAADRRAASGRPVAPHEAVDVTTALQLHGSGAVAVGDPADLCLADRSWADVIADPAGVGVAATVVDGRLVHPAS